MFPQENAIYQRNIDLLSARLVATSLRTKNKKPGEATACTRRWCLKRLTALRLGLLTANLLVMH